MLAEQWLALSLAIVIPLILVGIVQALRNLRDLPLSVGVDLSIVFVMLDFTIVADPGVFEPLVLTEALKPLLKYASLLFIALGFFIMVVTVLLGEKRIQNAQVAKIKKEILGEISRDQRIPVQYSNIGDPGFPYLVAHFCWFLVVMYIFAHLSLFAVRWQ